MLRNCLTKRQLKHTMIECIWESGGSVAPFLTPSLELRLITLPTLAISGATNDDLLPFKRSVVGNVLSCGVTRDALYETKVVSMALSHPLSHPFSHTRRRG